MSFSEISRKYARIKPGSEKRILLIDDQPEILMPLNLILANIGINATLVFDGYAAQSALKDQSFNLVVIDWKMPYLNGAECLTLADSTLYGLGRPRRKIPFVTYSGLNETEVSPPMTVYFERVGHWKKPMSPLELTKRMLSILNKIEG